jgi:hypothetical protein
MMDRHYIPLVKDYDGIPDSLPVIDKDGSWVKYEDVKKLEEENERLRAQLNVKGLTVNIKIIDIETIKEYLNYLKEMCFVIANNPENETKLLSYDEFKQKSI